MSAVLHDGGEAPARRRRRALGPVLAVAVSILVIGCTPVTEQEPAEAAAHSGASDTGGGSAGDDGGTSTAPSEEPTATGSDDDSSSPAGSEAPSSTAGGETPSNEI